VNAVSGPFGHLSSRNAGIEPERDGGVPEVIDLKSNAIREAIFAATGAEQPYLSKAATNYL
jgi:hypothetical protein